MYVFVKIVNVDKVQISLSVHYNFSELSVQLKLLFFHEHTKNVKSSVWFSNHFQTYKIIIFFKQLLIDPYHHWTALEGD